MSDLPWNLEYFTDTAGPDAPVALPATDPGAGTFTANWLSASRARNYLLDVSTDPEFSTFLPGYQDRVVLGLSDVLLGVSGVNFYRLRAANEFGTSAYSNVVQAIADFIEAPVAIAATNIEEDRFDANWNAVADPELDHYEVDVSDDPAFATLVSPGIPLDAGVALTLTITGLAPETDYYFRVRAVKANGVESANSNVVNAETEPLFVGDGGDEVIWFPDVGETVHIFDTVGADNFEVLLGSRAVRRLIVGGGGMGGGVNGSGVSCGGGGGGGVLDLDEVDRPAQLAVGLYPVVVGKGGNIPAALNVGEDGDDSSFGGDTAFGGGHGGSAGANVGSGGSGGGATNSGGGPEAAGAGTAGQGFAGGTGNAGSGGGGGGGGATEAGENGTAAKGGDGGDGLLSDITGEAVRYGAGGGGAVPVNAFGPIGGTNPGVGGLGGGGNGNLNAVPGQAATGIGAGGGGTRGNNPGGAGMKGRVAIRYKGRGANITPPPPDPAAPRGPITFADCEREQTVDAVTILVDCNSKNNSGIYPDYREYRCLGGGVIQSSRWDPAYSAPTGAVGNDGILVFRFSEPIRKFIITRRVTADVEAVPKLIACDDYTVIPSPSSSPAGSSQDGSIVGIKKISPEQVYYPAPHLEPPVDLNAEEEMSVEHADGFTCVVIVQGPDSAPVRTSEFVDPMFILLSD
jgi:hypothetical protein